MQAHGLVEELGILRVQLLDIDELDIEVVLQLARRVVEVGDTAGHTGGDVAAGLAEHDDAAAGHVLAGVVSDALDHRGHARISDAETLADNAAQEDLALRRAVGDDVAGDDVLLRDEVGGNILRRADHDAATGEPLADVVVGIAHDLELQPRCREGAERLTAGALQPHRQVPLLQVVPHAEAADDVAGDPRADGPERVLHRVVQLQGGKAARVLIGIGHLVAGGLQGLTLFHASDAHHSLQHLD